MQAPAEPTNSLVPTERPWAFQVALCLLGPLFFLSYLLTLLSPLPMLYLLAGGENKGQGRRWALAALVIGCLLVGFIKGPYFAGAYLVMAAVPALLLGELLLHHFRPDRAIALTFGLLAAVSVGSFFATHPTRESRQQLKAEVAAQVKAWNDRLLAGQPAASKEGGKEAGKEASKEAGKEVTPPLVLEEMPGVGASVLLLLCTLPCLALIRWNPKGFLRRTGIHRDYLRKWRAPEWLVWPTLLCGLFLVWEQEPFTLIAGNLLKPILVIYFFQGMSILAYFLDSLRVRGPLRVLLYGAGILFLVPMVVSFGFFDLWFNFRGRRKPPAEDRES